MAITGQNVAVLRELDWTHNLEEKWGKGLSPEDRAVYHNLIDLSRGMDCRSWERELGMAIDRAKENHPKALEAFDNYRLAKLIRRL